MSFSLFIIFFYFLILLRFKLLLPNSYVNSPNESFVTQTIRPNLSNMQLVHKIKSLIKILIE